MKQIKAKLHSCRGESLVEVLASILIATLSVGLLLGGIAVSANLERHADQSDENFYQTLNAAEERQTPVKEGVALSPDIQISEGGTSIQIPICIYGDEGLWSYGLNATPKGGDGS